MVYECLFKTVDAYGEAAFHNFSSRFFMHVI